MKNEILIEPKIISLHIYPIKSCAGIELSKVFVRKMGLVDDRQMMLVDADGEFLSQRKYPRLALFKLSKHAVGFNVKIGSNSILIQDSIFLDTKVDVLIWADKCKAYVANNETNNWFSDQLGKNVRLVKYAKDGSRVRKKAIPFETAFSDGYPILITNKSSLDALNRKLKNPIPMSRFRPNIVLDLKQPDKEYSFNKICLNQVKLFYHKPCVRCNIITINQITGAKLSTEPLNMLLDRNSSSAVFGINCSVLQEGFLHVMQC